MVLLTMTPSIVEALMKIHDTSRQSPDTSSSIQEETDVAFLSDPAVGKPISHGQILDIWKQLSGDGVRLEILLKGAAVYVPPPPPKPEPTKEYKELMARLRRQEEERSYEQMIQKAPPRESTTGLAHSFAEVNRPSNEADVGETDFEMGDVQKQMTLVINFLVSIIGSGIAIWLVARWWSMSARIFLSLGGALVVAIAEVAVYSAFTWRMSEGERKETKKKEVREVMHTWVVDKEKEGPPPTLLDEGKASEGEGGLRHRTKGNI